MAAMSPTTSLHGDDGQAKRPDANTSDTIGVAAPVLQLPVVRRDIGASDPGAIGGYGPALHRKPKEHRRRLVPRALILADVIGLSITYVVSTANWDSHGPVGSAREIIAFVTMVACWVAIARIGGLYGRDAAHPDHSTVDDVVGVAALVTAGVWLFFVISRIDERTSPSIDALLTFWGLATVLVPVARLIARALCRQSGAYIQNTVIVGAGDIGQLIGRKLLRHHEYGINVVGFVDRKPKERREDLPEHLEILGTPEELPRIVRQFDVERVVIAFSNDSIDDLVALLRQLRPLNIQIDLVPRLFEIVGPRTTVHSVEGIPLLGLQPVGVSVASRGLKRAIDVCGSAAGLLLLSPLLAFMAVRVKFDSPGPVLFRQTRLGQGMKEFTALKFRTMKVDTDDAVHREYIKRTMTSAAVANENGMYKLDRGDAVTPFGRWLRRTSLDELPQLINVLRGEMSLVGPRPCIPYEAEQFEPHHMERFLVPQGITGLWQVTARASSTYGEALDMDIAYVHGWSLGLDLRLILRTPLQLLNQRSATA